MDQDFDELKFLKEAVEQAGKDSKYFEEKWKEANAALLDAQNHIAELEDQKAEAFGYARDMEAASKESDQRLLQAQSENAVLREALMTCEGHRVGEDEYRFEQSFDQIKVEKALSGQSSRALIEDLERLKALRDQLRDQSLRATLANMELRRWMKDVLTILEKANIAKSSEKLEWANAISEARVMLDQIIAGTYKPEAALNPQKKETAHE